MAEYKTTMLIVVFISMFLISVVKNETFYGKENQHVKIEIESLSTRLRIDFPSKKLVVTNWYSSEVVKGYNVTFNGSILIFEIMKLTVDKEGWYKFGFSIPEKDGIHTNHVTKHIHVLIADISCGISYGKDFIGENDCQERDKVDAWCRIKLPRPTKENLTIEWEIKEMTRNFTDIRHISETDIEAHEVDAPLEVGDTFQCHSKTLKCSKTFEPRNIIYARNKTTREMFSYHFGSMTSNNKRPVECQANTSTSVSCVYHWVHNDGHMIRKFPGNMLLVEDLLKDGLYECYGSCFLRKNNLKPCVLLADRVEFSSVNKNPNSNSFTIIIVLLILILLFMVSFFILSVCRDRRDKGSNHDMHKSLVSSNSALLSPNPIESESNQGNIERPQNQPKDYDYKSSVREVASFESHTESSLISQESLLKELQRNKPQPDPSKEGNLLKRSPCVDIKEKTAEKSKKPQPQKRASNVFDRLYENKTSPRNQADDDNLKINKGIRRHTFSISKAKSSKTKELSSVFESLGKTRQGSGTPESCKDSGLSRCGSEASVEESSVIPAQQTETKTRQRKTMTAPTNRISNAVF